MDVSIPCERLCYIDGFIVFMPNYFFDERVACPLTRRPSVVTSYQCTTLALYVCTLIKKLKDTQPGKRKFMIASFSHGNKW